MKIRIAWCAPIRLQDGSSVDLIYRLNDLERIPIEPGIYVFLRRKGKRLVPMYIGQALKLRRRIRKQFNNLRLMKGIEKAPRRPRYLAYAVYTPTPGQDIKKVLGIVENSLIRYAMAQGHDLINIHGTRLREHHIMSSGSKDSRSWFPGEMSVEKRRGMK